MRSQLGADGVFVGSGIFKSESPERTARAMVEAATHFQDPAMLAKVSKGLGAPMRGIELAPAGGGSNGANGNGNGGSQRLAVRGW